MRPSQKLIDHLGGSIPLPAAWAGAAGGSSIILLKQWDYLIVNYKSYLYFHRKIFIFHVAGAELKNISYRQEIFWQKGYIDG